MNIQLLVFLSFPFTYEAANTQCIKGKKKKLKKNYCEKWLHKCYFLLFPFVSLFFN